MNEIKKFVVDGGPCAGKTTALSLVMERMRDFGYQVFVVPEVATELFSNGVKIGSDGISLREFQKQALLMQLEREDRYFEIAKRSREEKKLIVCDRGGATGSAYMEPAAFLKLLKEMGVRGGLAEIHSRYQGVFHLVTAADGAEEFYTLTNNKARRETLEEARVLDKKTKNAWSGHPHWRAIDNSTDFSGKMQRFLQKLCYAVGIPAPLEIEKKYLLRTFDIGVLVEELENPPVRVSIEQTYLRLDSAGSIRRIRKREYHGGSIYYYEEKKRVNPGVRIETGRIISKREYLSFLNGEADPECDTIKKDRYCFIWKNQYFELDIFHEPLRHFGKAFLEIELTEENDKIELPPFLNIERDVTNEEEFSNVMLAHK